MKKVDKRGRFILLIGIGLQLLFSCATDRLGLDKGEKIEFYVSKDTKLSDKSNIRVLRLETSDKSIVGSVNQIDFIKTTSLFWIPLNQESSIFLIVMANLLDKLVLMEEGPENI